MKPNKISISFTKEELDWLAWAITDVLAESVMTNPGKKAAEKITTAVDLLKNIEIAMAEAVQKEFGDDAAVRKN
ncbi:hypothetical protein EBZ39_00650 [bacterium]|nr:hypothetical protein [bacterium]